MSLDDLLECWSYWRLMGMATKLKRKHEAEEGGGGFAGSMPLHDDDVEQRVEKIFMDGLTDDQRLVMVVEYRASRKVPYFRSGLMRSAFVKMDHAVYRKHLQRARRIMSTKLGIV